MEVATNEALDAVDVALHDMDARPRKNHERVSVLLSAVFRLGVSLQGNIPSTLRDRLDRQAEVIAANAIPIRFYIATWDEYGGIGPYETTHHAGEIWARLSHTRSALEFLRSVYGTTLTEGDSALDVEVFDDMIRSLQREQGGVREDKIPDGIPATHWWWRAN